MAKDNSKFSRLSKAYAERQVRLAKIRQRMSTPVPGGDAQQIAQRLSAGRNFSDLQGGGGE